VLNSFKAIWINRHLLWSLTKNDFKQKYIENILGIAWAFIQPTATILIFWFVFQVGFKARPVDNFPFILWLVAGMVPWFFFADGLSNGTNSILENSYLVKKVVFRVSLLPIVKILSAIVIHLFFLFFMMGMYIIYGYKPSLYWLQLFYYMFATIFLLLGLSWITSSVIIFFKDVGQVVAVILQFGFWLTPIFWHMNKIPKEYRSVIELNPMVYIIDGYRNSLIYHKWFWEDMHMTLYFWVTASLIFSFGVFVFRRLRPHFADVL